MAHLIVLTHDLQKNLQPRDRRKLPEDELDWAEQFRNYICRVLPRRGQLQGDLHKQRRRSAWSAWLQWFAGDRQRKHRNGWHIWTSDYSGVSSRRHSEHPSASPNLTKAILVHIRLHLAAKNKRDYRGGSKIGDAPELSNQELLLRRVQESADILQTRRMCRSLATRSKLVFGWKDLRSWARPNVSAVWPSTNHEVV